MAQVAIPCCKSRRVKYNLLSLFKIYLTVLASSHQACASAVSDLPILSGVGYSSDELHSIRVVVWLRMETQVLLHEIPWGHVTLPIFVSETGVL